jgi:hypothetical protein
VGISDRDNRSGPEVGTYVPGGLPFLSVGACVIRIYAFFALAAGLCASYRLLVSRGRLARFARRDHEEPDGARRCGDAYRFDREPSRADEIDDCEHG